MNAWLCDRCGAVTNAGSVDDPPYTWRQTLMPVRGSSGNRSPFMAVICGDCDDSLFRWLRESTS